ncbi:MAG TPA: glycosyltransferase family 2 protein [Solirubrobacteraceae bacterium]|nr:glycosyltransferase family 2 protein [Solirubrobacteraceae bacterium]
MRTVRRAARAGAVCATTIGGLGSGHLLVLLGAVVCGRATGSPPPCDDLSLAVVIPAHDEETQVAATVRSIKDTDYDTARRRVIVIADNCTDRTAAVAQAAGAEVWERSDPLRRGKGHALAWAFARLLEDESVEAVCVIDADCEVSGNLLTAVAARLRAGADAVQVPYLVANPESSAATALRWAGFALFNVVRPLGRDRLGLSTGLLGTGMAFSRRLLLRAPWSAFSFAEDREQHMRWVLGGARVVFAPEAEVSSPSPSTGAGARAQERRWESGRGALARGLTPRLLARSLRTKDPAQLDAALEPILPPQSLLLSINVAGLAAARLAGARGTGRWAAASLLAQATYVIGGLAVVRAPASVWRAFASLPRFLARRMGILASAGAGPSAWERTPRDPAS